MEEAEFRRLPPPRPEIVEVEWLCCMGERVQKSTSRASELPTMKLPMCSTQRVVCRDCLLKTLESDVSKSIQQFLYSSSFTPLDGGMPATAT